VTGNGLYKLADQRNNWTKLPKSPARPLAIDSSGTIYLGIAGGIRKSTEGGTSRSDELWGTADKKIFQLGCSRKSILAATAAEMGYVSTDGGVTWPCASSLGLPITAMIHNDLAGLFLSASIVLFNSTGYLSFNR
jgi:hypothetical protein